MSTSDEGFSTRSLPPFVIGERRSEADLLRLSACAGVGTMLGMGAMRVTDITPPLALDDDRATAVQAVRT
jgi:hypothetical protein